MENKSSNAARGRVRQGDVLFATLVRKPPLRMAALGIEKGHSNIAIKSPGEIAGTEKFKKFFRFLVMI
jgi:hypothetical protein